MSENSEEIINQFGEDLAKDMKEAIPKATGRTRDSVRLESREKGFDIFGGAQIGAIIDGRGPTSSRASRGEKTLQQSILEYIQALSIQPREPSMTQEQLSWAMSNSIHKKGYRGKGNIFENVLTKNRIDSLTKTLLKDQLVSIQSDVIKSIELT